MIWNNEELVGVLKGGGVVVMPTDTLYGIVGKAHDQSVVEKIYKARRRSPQKPCIILIADISELENFSIHLSEIQKIEIKKYWPGPVSVIFDCLDEKLFYLHRGTKTLGFRIPLSESLQDLLRQTGPLLAPSANIEGMTPAKNILEAKEYFGNAVDLYVDMGEVTGRASKVVILHPDGTVSVLRE